MQKDESEGNVVRSHVTERIRASAWKASAVLSLSTSLIRACLLNLIAQIALGTPIAAQTLLAGSLSVGQEQSIQGNSVRTVHVEGTVNAPVAEVWRVWTTSQGAEEFFAQKVNIQLAIGGAYEIQFDPKDERSGTKGLKILSYLPEEMISFQWNAPPEYPEVRNGGTWVVVQMRPEGPNRTHVAITHLGWKQGSEWDAAYAHFVQGWGDLMKRLERRFTEGPIDWNKERMMYQEVKK
jgi:uncharacterized protein YndB with AHSA1/START domain